MILKVGRNQPCPCGSGKKYKKCHGSFTVAPPPQPSVSKSFVEQTVQRHEAAERIRQNQQGFGRPVVSFSMDVITEKIEKAYDARAIKWQAALSAGAADFGHKYLEKPAMVRQIPRTLFGKKVLCIGVGAGNELEEILKRQPDKVVGIDVSTKLLNIAKSRFPQVEFQRIDMAQMTFGNEEFDFVYSSLVFHYAKDWDALLAEVNRVLKRGGELLFSTHHPVYWSRKTPTGNSYTNQRGVTLTEYNAVLPGNVEITYYNHVNKQAITEALEYASFEVKHAFAPSVVEVRLADFSPANAQAYKNKKANNTTTPFFFIVSAVKK